MENITNILYSLVPLIVIIFLSWLFSQMGAKAKKPTAGTEKESGSLPGDQIFQILLGKSSPERAASPSPENPPHRDSGMNIESWNVDTPIKGPEPTPKPITPKWWGA